MCVICLCVGRIGLAWAHDVFYFACHMFNHFHAYVLSFSYIWYIWTAWDFFYCSSLFLPLNLFTLVVSMAPKCKSTPAWNSFHSGVSSSTDPSPSNVQFRDDDAFKAFSENFSRRGIHSERQVVLSDFTDTDLPFIIHNRRWVTVWHPDHMSSRAYPGVLLQHARDWSFSTSLFHSRLRYAHSCYTAAGCGCASCL